MKREDDRAELLNDPERAAALADTARGASLARAGLGARQRLAVAQGELRRAERYGEDEETMRALRAELAPLEAELQVKQELFLEADGLRPETNADVATVYGQTRPAPAAVTKSLPLTAALIGRRDEVLAAAAVDEVGRFSLQVPGNVDGARLQLSDAGQAILFRDAEDFSVPAGQIAYREASLEPAKPAPSPPPTVVTMPDLERQSEDVACAMLAQIGVMDVALEDAPNSSTPGLVVGQTPAAGAVLEDGQGVTLVIGRAGAGEVVVRLPDFRGQRAPVAQERAAALGVAVEIILEDRDQGPTNVVIAQSVPAGTPVSEVEFVELTVSQVVQDTRVEVPNVEGLDADLAVATLRRVGLREAISEERLRGVPGRVVEQRPDADSRVDVGSVVTLFLGAGLREPVEPIPENPTRPRDADAFRARLAVAMAADERMESLPFDAADLPKALELLKVEDAESAEEVLGMEPATIRDRLELGNLRNATRFRSILRTGLARMRG